MNREMRNDEHVRDVRSNFRRSEWSDARHSACDSVLHFKLPSGSMAVTRPLSECTNVSYVSSGRLSVGGLGTTSGGDTAV